MASTLGSIGAASPGMAALVTTAGGADGAAPVIVAAYQDADTLMLAVAPMPLAGAAPPAAGARRPVRTSPAAGWAQPMVQTLLPKTAGASASGAAKKTATTAASASTSSAAKATASSSTKKSTDPLSFLGDSKLSVEEKLMKFLAWVSDKNEKELLKKMDEIHAKQTKKSSSGGGKGLLGSIAGGAGKLLGSVAGKVALAAIPGIGPFLAAGGIGLNVLTSLGGSGFLGQITGPVLAAGASGLGFPGLAPALMKAAPAIAEGAMSLLGATGGAAEAGESGSTTTTTRSKTGDISQTDLVELQILKDRQQQAFGTITNILKAMHDTKMAVINNLR